MIIKWNDESTYYGGICGRTPFKKGDILPSGVIPDNQIEQFLKHGKIIIIKPEPMKPIKLSISVMAHPSRAHFFPELQKKLNIPMSLFSVDKKNDLIENCKAAWRLHDKNADFHVVIQDDAIVCNSFKERAEAFITEMEAERIAKNEPVYGYNFFIRPEYSEAQMQAFYKKGYQLLPQNRGGVAICLPVKQIESMLKFYDTLKIRHDDERISQWIRKKGFRMCFPIPSLVDHDDHNPSLAGNGIGLNRQAYKYIDNLNLVIPKIIHQLWIGDKPAPKKWMQTWKEKNPSWEYKLWTEKEISAKKWINKKHIDFYCNKKIWHGVKDVCQYEILYNEGGCFFDADTECLLPVDELFCENFDAYSCWENEKARPGLIQPVIAAVKNSQFCLELIEGLSKLEKVGEPWKTTGNRYVGEMFRRTKQKVKIFPSYLFIPEHYSGEKYTGCGRIYSRHYYGSTIDNIYEKGV